MSFPGTTIEERFLRAALRFCSMPSGAPAWDMSSVASDWLWYLMNFPNNTCENPPKRMYCGIVEVDILKDGSTATALEQGEEESDFDYLGRLLEAELVGS